jgi:SNF2 family DNA or RNA helicase
MLERSQPSRTSTTNGDYQVLRYASTEKFLIFSKSGSSLMFLAESLVLAGIPHMEFTARVHPKVREQLVTTFETSEMHRVFLMELRHGARGL